MPEGPDDAVQQEKEMREHEAEARERSGAESGSDGLEESESAPPGNVGTGTVSGGS